MKKILLAGGSGLIGTALARKLRRYEYEIRILTTSEERAKSPNTYLWNLEEDYLDLNALDDIWGIINLAGAGIVDRPWSPSRKIELLQSRTKGNALLIKSLQTLSMKPEVFIGASAIGFYGNRPGELLTEESLAGPSSFLVDLCQAWEKSTEGFESMGMRRVTIRIGLVLSKEGGVVMELSKTLPLGFVTYFGDGQQGASWIHMDDLTDMFQYLLEHKKVGVYNGVAPSPTTFKSLVTEILKQKWKMGLVLPVPKLFLEWGLGERATVVLQDAKVLPARLSADSGFQFKYSDKSTALASVLG